MKKAIFFHLSLILSATMTWANTDTAAAGLEQKPEQKIEISSAECHSSFGNMFCSGDYTCKQAALQNAEANHCKLDIKKIESQRHDDFISSEISYRSYSCSVVAASDCSSPEANAPTKAVADDEAAAPTVAEEAPAAEKVQDKPSNKLPDKSSKTATVESSSTTK